MPTSILSFYIHQARHKANNLRVTTKKNMLYNIQGGKITESTTMKNVLLSQSYLLITR